MALDLLTTERATMTVSLDNGSGSVTDLGLAFRWALSANVVDISVVDGVIYASALHAGTANLNVTTMDGSVVTNVAVTVSADPDSGEPSLIVTFGTPEPK